MRKKKNGFSLIELMVVASIIGILSTLGLTAFTTSQSRARDSKRQEDVTNIMKAVEIMYSGEGSYPSYYGPCSSMPGLADYFPQGIPADPKTGESYGCYWGVGPTAYCVTSWQIEKDNNHNCEEECAICSGECLEENGPAFCAWSSQE